MGVTNIGLFHAARPHVDHEIVEYVFKVVMAAPIPAQDEINRPLEMRQDQHRDTDPYGMDHELRVHTLRVIPKI